MKINSNELRAVVDVDGTLVRPARLEDKNCIKLDYYGTVTKRVPLVGNIELMKAWKKRGYEITVHSANGSAWAAEVIIKLGLQEYVDEVAAKPLKSLDDLEANQWLPRVFVEEF